MSNLESRLRAAELELADRARQQAQRNERCGVTPWIVRDGFITMCVYVPCDRIPAWQEWGSLARKKATCPDVVTCVYSDVCSSGESLPQTQ